MLAAHSKHNSKKIQTQFGEDRCTQFRVIVVTDPQSHKHTTPTRLPVRCKLLILPPRDTSVTTRLTHHLLFTHKLWPTPLPTNIVTPNPLHTSLPAPMYIYAHCLFRMLFLSTISTAYDLLSGSRAARLLLN